MNSKAGRLRLRARLGATLLVAVLGGVAVASAPTTSTAAIMTFGSQLSVAATLNTSENLNYQGTNTLVPPSSQAPNGVVHTAHLGSDTALWSVTSASGTASAPAGGQALKVSVEGCAQSAPGGPTPLNQIHLQDVSPLAGGGAKVNLTSQPFEIPVCGRGAGASTVTTYEPVNLCVSKGDYVDFNDEGGFVEPFYRAGVAYQVMGSVPGSTSNSFIRAGGTNNGATLSPSDTAALDGFASSPNEELMLQVTLGTGPNATHICGGTGGLAAPLPPIRVSPQTDGVNRSGVVSVAIYCRPTSGCQGALTLTAPGASATYGHTSFNLRGDKTAHVQVHLARSAVALLHSKRGGLRVALSAVVAGKTVTQTIALKAY